PARAGARSFRSLSRRPRPVVAAGALRRGPPQRTLLRTNEDEFPNLWIAAATCRRTRGPSARSSGLVARRPLLAQPLVEAIDTAGELVDALCVLLRLARSRLRGGQRVGSGSFDRGEPGIDPVDALVHGGDLLVDIASRGAAAESEGAAEDRDSECHLVGGKVHSGSFRMLRWRESKPKPTRKRSGKRNKAIRSAIRAEGLAGERNRDRLT